VLGIGIFETILLALVVDESPTSVRIGCSRA
jgi:hypothetical protein